MINECSDINPTESCVYQQEAYVTYVPSLMYSDAVNDAGFDLTSLTVRRVKSRGNRGAVGVHLDVTTSSDEQMSLFVYSSFCLCLSASLNYAKVFMIPFAARMLNLGGLRCA